MAKSIIHETSLAGKTVIITGGNSGLGWEFARQSLILNASRVIITTRSEDKGIAAIEALRADPIVQSSNTTGKLEFFDLDLDDYQSGIHFTQRVKQEVAELDILLCNGGINQFRYELSKSGHERIMQVNSYTHFLIVLCLLPLLKATAAKRNSPSRVTFLSSFSHIQHTLEKTPIGADESILAHHDSKENFHGRRQYQNSKLAINAFAQRLATTISPSEVIVNTVCPGAIRTNLNRELPCWIKPILYLYFKVKGHDPLVGGQILINAVVCGKESHGKYLELDKINSGALFLTRSTGKDYIERLWNEILEESIKVNREVKEIS
ncbi:Short chain dehydrogenase sor7 [Penicillium lividum]|nr:Short chain dehydrogenase sor7 [Penicillium lividum]